jgi:predicted 3-demethylubiquinone-9 3-methyltransferase (glyoxalase superfamily)
MPNSVAPFLMFEGKAEEAMNFYVSLIPGSRIDLIERYDAAEDGSEGSVLMASFSLGGLTIKCNDCARSHAFTFTPYTSLFVTCKSEEEIDHLATNLSTGGETLLPLGNYGFSRKFAWLTDRFGVSWQLSLDSDPDSSRLDEGSPLTQ